MILTKTKSGHEAVILLPGDLSLLIKALHVYSEEIAQPEHEQEAYHCDALKNAFQFWLFTQELEFRASVEAIDKARQAFNKASEMKEVAHD